MAELDFEDGAPVHDEVSYSRGFVQGFAMGSLIAGGGSIGFVFLLGAYLLCHG